ADLLDIGGESTRPGATRVAPEEELRRVLPVLIGLADAGAPLSVDTMRAEVAGRALEAGASIINDVSGGKADPAMAPLIAERGCPYILSHWRGPSHVMNTLAHYDDVVTEVIAERPAPVDAVVDAGVSREQTSRERVLGELRQRRGVDAGPNCRDQATAAVTAIAAHHGVWGVRVHEVSASVDAISVAEAIRMAKNG